MSLDTTNHYAKANLETRRRTGRRSDDRKSSAIMEAGCKLVAWLDTL
ncbi:MULTISPECIES: hypothetical protein [unclassified Mesorhizobium]|nr:MULTISPECIES: hypothetical protein [unclassified Mesorhizobium]WJI84417.1 hypothetical protein NLY34_30850 [Mesorhizobium sp. C374B]WJI90472.1 hypothetical protein NLY42_01585 [Mesorhizobium sp. C372A]